MRKIILLLVVLVLSFNITYSWTTKTTKNGMDNGPGKQPTYDEVSKEDYWIFTRISCKNPGREECPKSITEPGPKQDAVQNAEDYANNQIVLNNLVGSHYFAATNRNVKWKATSSSFGSEREIITWSSVESEPDFNNN